MSRRSWHFFLICVVFSFFFFLLVFAFRFVSVSLLLVLFLFILFGLSPFPSYVNCIAKGSCFLGVWVLGVERCLRCLSSRLVSGEAHLSHSVSSALEVVSSRGSPRCTAFVSSLETLVAGIMHSLHYCSLEILEVLELFLCGSNA